MPREPELEQLERRLAALEQRVAELIPKLAPVERLAEHEEALRQVLADAEYGRRRRQARDRRLGTLGRLCGAAGALVVVAESVRQIFGG